MSKTSLLDVSIRANSIRISPKRTKEQLGRYYLDLTGALPLIEGHYHGPCDESGVPLNDVGDQGDFYNVITISQSHSYCNT